MLVAGYERAVDPNDDGDTSDAPDVLSFSGGVDYGTESSVEARAAQRVVNMGVVFVASAGNSGNQPIGVSAYIEGTPANAPGVISVAASIDEFRAQNLTVDTPATALPDGGLMVNQEWSPALGSDLSDGIVDAREFDEPADPASPAGTDRMLCDPIAGTPFAGKIALVYKASTSTGDCFADDKVVNAQDAGAEEVVLWNGFGGLPSQIGIGGDGSDIDVPVVMLSSKRLRSARRDDQPRRRQLQLQHRRDHGHAARHRGAVPGVRRRDDRLHLGGPGPGVERAQARHHGARLRHPVHRERHRRPGREALRHLDGGAAHLRRGDAAAPGPSRLVAGADQGSADEQLRRST